MTEQTLPPREREKLDRDLRKLRQVTKALGSLSGVEEQLPVIMDVVVDLTGAERAYFLLANEHGELELKAQRVDETGRGSADARAAIERVTRTSQPFFLLEDDVDAQIAAAKDTSAIELRTAMCAPLMAGFGLLGVLYVESTSSTALFSARHREAFTTLVDSLTLSLENARLHESSAVDLGTGLPNHSAFMRRLNEEFRRAERYGRSLSLLIVHLDAYARFEQTYGKVRTAAVLRLVANTVRDSVRNVDVPARYAPDAFAVVAPETEGPTDLGEAGALQIAERIRKGVEAMKFPGGERITVSVGLAAFPSLWARDVIELINVADRALFAAREQGNAVVTAKDLFEGGEETLAKTDARDLKK